MRKLRFWAFLTVMTLLVIALTGCSNQAKEEKKADALLLGFSQLGSESGWRIGNTKSVQDAAEAAGVRLMLENANQSQEKQLTALRSFIAYRVDVISEFERVARRHNMSLFEEKKRAELAGRRILLAEDMEINAEIIMDILAMKDAETDHAENGRVVVDMFKESAVNAYAAILMDVRMPEMDGLEAAAAIRALDRPDAKRIPIIALTANAFDEDVQRSLQAGMNAHLSKPVEPDHLYQTLEELIYEADAEKTTA